MEKFSFFMKDTANFPMDKERTMMPSWCAGMWALVDFPPLLMF